MVCLLTELLFFVDYFALEVDLWLCHTSIAELVCLECADRVQWFWWCQIYTVFAGISNSVKSVLTSIAAHLAPAPKLSGWYQNIVVPIIRRLRLFQSRILIFLIYLLVLLLVIYQQRKLEWKLPRGLSDVHELQQGVEKSFNLNLLL